MVLLKAEITLRAEDDMIEQGQAQYMGRFLKPLRCCNVVVPGLHVPRRMIVRYDDGTGPVFQRIRKDLARMHLGSV